jgi:Arc/MetJ-type ribon-helix-helix transcriptional regulator
MTDVIRSTEMADRAISVRLDAEAQQALDELISRGLSQSDAIRQALIASARSSVLEQVRAEAQLVGGDPADRALMAEIREAMDELAPPG